MRIRVIHDDGAEAEYDVTSIAIHEEVVVSVNTYGELLITENEKEE